MQPEETTIANSATVPLWDDVDTPYQMPAFAGRNILIFSDGTGQAGGVLVDEFRSNVYKLFRATRCGPDTSIDPDRQLAYYDPGLGSKLAGENIKVRFLRRIYNGLSSATGLGITRNLIDCYVALIKLWRPGDRIFLFGFSRGAYTVRCLAGILGLCGIPTRLRNGNPLLRNPDVLAEIAKEAVKRVYRHGSGAADTDDAHTTERSNALKAQRDALGRQFRERYGSDTPDGANAIPHFIGVWDTVAAVGVSSSAAPMLWGVAAVATASVSALISSVLSYFFGGIFWLTLLEVVAVAAAAGIAGYFSLRFKMALDVPGFKWWQTIHLTNWKMTFFDRRLNPRVRYARHALALDEMRADFDRVAWIFDAKPLNREKAEGAFLKQLWFAGNHSDVGGSYPENESRLSDIALKWMATEAKKAGLHVNGELLQTYGRHTGPQHDECRNGVRVFGLKFAWRQKHRKIVANATLHPSVRARFEGPPVVIYDEEKQYRPPLLTAHEDFAAVYSAESSKVVSS